MFDTEREWVQEGFGLSPAEGIRRATVVEVGARLELLAEMARIRRQAIVKLYLQLFPGEVGGKTAYGASKEVGGVLGMTGAAVRKQVAVSRAKGEL